MAKKPTIPLKVTAKLIDGRFNSIDGIIMLDGILYHAWFCKHAPHVLEGMGEYDTRGYYIGLPLRQLPDNRWAASMGIYRQISSEIEFWNKRPDFFAADKMDLLDMSKGIISDSVGQKRAYRTPCIIHTVEDGIVEFYCMGHGPEILDLLSYIPAVGKKPAIGWGIVAEWTVEKIADDYSYIHPIHGLMRPTPVEDAKLEGYAIMDYAVKPPYWKTCNHRRCYIPNANFEQAQK